MKKILLTISTLISIFSFTCSSNAQYSVPSGTKIIESKMITNNLFLTTTQSNQDYYINVNGTTNGPYLSITNQYLSDNGNQYSYQYTKNQDEQQNSIYHLVVNGQDYITDYRDILWSLNRQHFAFVNKKSSSDNGTLYVDGKEVLSNQYLDQYLSRSLSISNDGKYIATYFTDSSNSTNILNINGNTQIIPSYGTPKFSRDGLHYAFLTDKVNSVDQTHPNIDGQTISTVNRYKDLYFSENGEHYIFSYTLADGMGYTFGVNVDGKNLDTSSFSYGSVKLNETSISNDGTYRFFGYKLVGTISSYSDLKTVITNINGKLTEYTRDTAISLADSIYDGRDFFFSFSTNINGKSEIYKNDIQLAKDVIFGSNYFKTSNGHITFQFENSFYYDDRIYGPLKNISGVSTSREVYLLDNSTFIRGKVIPGIISNSSGLRLTSKGFYSLDLSDRSKPTININGITSKISNTQIQDIYLSEDLSIASYIDGTKLKVAPTTSLLQVTDSTKLVPKTIDLPKSIPTVTDSTLGLYLNYEPIHIVNESNRELTMNKVIYSKTLFFHQLHINGYQSYPYVTKEPSINEMNENNSFIGYYKTPKGYQVLSIDVVKKVDSKNDFIIKLDSKNSRYFITPTDERVHREMYTIDNDKKENHYDLIVTYQQGKLKAKKMIIKDNIFYEYGFNFDRDAFSIGNTKDELGSGLPSLGIVKLLYTDLYIYKSEGSIPNITLRELSLKELLDIGIIDDNKDILSNLTYKYKGKKLGPNFVKYLLAKGQFIGYCFGFVTRNNRYKSNFVTLNEWNSSIQNISQIKNKTTLDNGEKEFQNVTKSDLQKNILLSHILGTDWLLQSFSNKLKNNYELNKTEFSNRVNTFEIRSKRNTGHAVLGYKQETYKNPSSFGISLTGKPTLYFDKNNDHLFSQEECLGEDKSTCSTINIEKIKFLERVYVYDSSYIGNIDNENIYLYELNNGKTGWVLTSQKDYYGSLGDKTLQISNILDKISLDSYFLLQ